MKKLITICLLIAITFTVSAQAKSALTKNETIQYLNKKANECEGHFRTPDDSAFAKGVARKMYYKELSFELSDEKVSIKVMSSNNSENDYSKSYFERYNKQSFNPSQIISIANETTNLNEPLGLILITLKSNSCVSEQSVKYHNGNSFSYHDPTAISSKSEVGLVFLNADPENYNKIKKALEYLRDLYKAEDDPFGE